MLGSEAAHGAALQQSSPATHVCRVRPGRGIFIDIYVYECTCMCVCMYIFNRLELEDLFSFGEAKSLSWHMLRL